MNYQVTQIEFNLEDCPFCGGDCYTEQTNVCRGYLANPDAVEQIEKASNQVIGQIWDADNEKDLIEEITCSYGFGVKNIDYVISSYNISKTLTQQKREREMNDQEKIKQLETLIESILSTLESANGSMYNPNITDAIEEYKSEMRVIID